MSRVTAFGKKRWRPDVSSLARFHMFGTKGRAMRYIVGFLVFCAVAVGLTIGIEAMAHDRAVQQDVTITADEIPGSEALMSSDDVLSQEILDNRAAMHHLKDFIVEPLERDLRRSQEALSLIVAAAGAWAVILFLSSRKKLN